MLTSITPLGERGRGHRWGVTTTWLLVGHVVGGLALGALMAGLGVVLARLGVDPDARVAAAIIATAAVIAVMLDLAGATVPGRRQVDERWLTAYRGWAYGIGFGVQLGFGLVTVVNTALLGAVVVAGAVVGPVGAVVLGLFYGTVRGVAATAGGRVRSIGDLHRLHRRIDTTNAMVGRVGAGIVATAAAAAVMVVVT